MSKSKKKGKKGDKGGGFGRALFGLVALSALAVGGVYFVAPDMFARGVAFVAGTMP